MRAYYTADRAKFFSDSDDQILGELARANTFALDLEQKGVAPADTHPAQCADGD